MASQLIGILRGEARRLLRDHGYPSGGQTFRKVSATGSIGIIAIGAPAKPPPHDAGTYLFTVQFGVWVPTPRPWLSAALNAELADKKRHLYEANTIAEVLPTAESRWSRLLSTRDSPTEQLVGDGHYGSMWALHTQHPSEPVRRDLVSALTDIVLPAVDHQLATFRDPFDGPGAGERVSVRHVLPPFEPTVGYIKGPPTGGGIFSDEVWR